MNENDLRKAIVLAVSDEFFQLAYQRAREAGWNAVVAHDIAMRATNRFEAERPVGERIYGMIDEEIAR